MPCNADHQFGCVKQLVEWCSAEYIWQPHAGVLTSVLCLYGILACPRDFPLALHAVGDVHLLCVQLNVYVVFRHTQ